MRRGVALAIHQGEKYDIKKQQPVTGSLAHTNFHVAPCSFLLCRSVGAIELYVILKPTHLTTCCPESITFKDDREKMLAI